MRLLTILLLLQITVLVSCKSKKKKPSDIKINSQSARHENPSYLKDRKKRIIYKPMYPEDWGMEKRKPYSINWKDYCAPYHCGDYHKPACGLNRRKMKFQWFQSNCHIVLNNKCASYRGFLKFDMVDTKYCRAYVMYALRSGCPQSCPATEDPICAVHVETNKAVVFKNICYLYKKNCQGVMQDFVEVPMNVCQNDIELAAEALQKMSDQSTTDESWEDLTRDESTQVGDADENRQEIDDENLSTTYYVA